MKKKLNVGIRDLMMSKKNQRIHLRQNSLQQEQIENRVSPEEISATNNEQLNNSENPAQNERNQDEEN